jgi:uncharacterized protein (TIGR02246 family)
MTSPTSNEQAIRNVITSWLQATAAGDVDAILPLMAEDVVFLLPGQSPMRGRDSFATGLRGALTHFSVTGVSEIQEIQISGNLAYCWNHLTVTMTPRTGNQPPKRRSGNVLSIFRKEPAGNWVICRDANMLTATEPS